jgi:hypothetical protein
MDQWMREWASAQSFLIKRHQFEASTIEEIIDIVKEYTNTNDLTTSVVERITHNGFQMKLHRDDYRFDNNAFKRGNRDDTLWIPIYTKEKRPIYTVVWYQSTQGIDFVGGNLRFFDGFTVRPKKYTAILFDSNDLHEVTLQTTKDGLTNERKVSLIKFYL